MREELGELFPRQGVLPLGGDGGDERKDGDGDGDGNGVRKKYFLRLDFCSTKDAVVSGLGRDPKIIESVDDIVERLVTSQRAITALQDHTRLQQEKKVHDRPRVYLFPFREDIKSGREYRVFCPPCPRGLEFSRVAAVSQDRYHEPFDGNREGESVEATARRVLDGILDIHRRILMVAIKAAPWLSFLLKEEGFVFDVFDPLVDGDVEFVEVNPFGAMSGCGSALFHWIKDARILYNVGGAEGIDFRVTMVGAE